MALKQLPKGKLQTAKFPGSATMTSTNAITTFNKDYRLVGITIHFGTATSQSVSVYVRSDGVTEYDTLLKVFTLSAATDIAWAPGEYDLKEFPQGDELYLVWADAAVAYWMRIKIEEL